MNLSGHAQVARMDKIQFQGRDSSPFLQVHRVDQFPNQITCRDTVNPQQQCTGKGIGKPFSTGNSVLGSQMRHVRFVSIGQKVALFMGKRPMPTSLRMVHVHIDTLPQLLCKGKGSGNVGRKRGIENTHPDVVFWKKLRTARDAIERSSSNR